MLTGTGPVLGLLAGLVAGQGQRQDLDPATFPLAKCNDGTQANYYHQPGEPHGKFVINLQVCFSSMDPISILRPA